MIKYRVEVYVLTGLARSIFKGQDCRVYQIETIQNERYDAYESEPTKEKKTLVYTGTVADCWAWVKFKEGGYFENE